LLLSAVRLFAITLSNFVTEAGAFVWFASSKQPQLADRSTELNTPIGR
jgi:hypothetical protein